ncbi:MAG: hypothetical protein AAGA99_21260, partial [Actinomycetota bacterium]
RDASEADLVVAQREARRALERLASLRPLTRHLAHYIDREGGGWPVYETIRSILDGVDPPSDDASPPFWTVRRDDGKHVWWDQHDAAVRAGEEPDPKWPNYGSHPAHECTLIAERWVVVERRERTIPEGGAS